VGFFNETNKQKKKKKPAKTQEKNIFSLEVV